VTTIAVSLAACVMAADSRMTVVNETFGTEFAAPCTKLVRFRDWIVGGAGDNEDILKTFVWWGDRRKRRPRVGKDFEFVALSRTRLLHIVGNSPPEALRNGYYAVGTGAHFALASMTTQALLGLDPDPRLAVQVACQHDMYSTEPVDFLSWKTT
jgi:hypothetical protein